MRLFFPVLGVAVLGLGAWVYSHGGQGLLDATANIASGPKFKIDTYEKTVTDLNLIGPNGYHQETRLRIVSMEEKPVTIKEIILNKAAPGTDCDLVQNNQSVVVLPYVTSGLGDTIEFGPGVCGTVVNVQLKTDKGLAEYDVR